MRWSPAVVAMRMVRKFWLAAVRMAAIAVSMRAWMSGSENRMEAPGGNSTSANEPSARCSVTAGRLIGWPAVACWTVATPRMAPLSMWPAPSSTVARWPVMAAAMAAVEARSARVNGMWRKASATALVPAMVTEATAPAGSLTTRLFRMSSAWSRGMSRLISVWPLATSTCLTIWARPPDDSSTSPMSSPAWAVAT